MESFLFIKPFLILFFLSFCAFLSGSEVALFSLGPFRLQKMKEEKQSSARIVERLLGQPRRLLISILLGNEIGNIAAATIAGPLFIYYLGERGEWIAIFTMTFLIIFFCEIIPKSLGFSYPDKISALVASPLMKFISIISPVRWVINQLVDGIMSLLRIKRDPRENIYLEAEFKDLVDLGQREGSIEEGERDLINRVFRLGDTKVSTIMTPKQQMFTLPVGLGLEKLTKLVKEKQFSRIPIYSKDRNNIVGILNVKDLLPFINRRDSQETSISKLLRTPFFIPQNKRIDELLKELQQKKIHMAIVVSEHGKVTGLVTMEDILEEIFGEIYDEYDR